jgi:hypothetical protein
VRIQLAIPEKFVTAPVLNGALEAVTRLNEAMIAAGAAPTDLDLLRKGAIWKPEPPGDEHFDHGKEIESRGWGDCDDWAPLRAGRLRATGEDPGARAVVRKSGPQRWHATVIRSDGSEDDPSLDAGMPGPARKVGVRGAWVPTMRESVSGVNGTYIATPHLALRPIADRHGMIESWQARTDLPWHWRPKEGDFSPTDLAMATLHQTPVSSQAIVGACAGAIDLGIACGADPEHLKHLSAVADLCEGYPWEEVAARYGHEHATRAGAIVGSFFGKAFKKLKGVAKGALKIATPALSLVPGGGLASAALHMASPALKRSLGKARHAPPELRPGASPAAAAAARSRGGSAAPRGVVSNVPAGNGCNVQLILPAPVLCSPGGWSSAAGAQPGVAWPPRGA